MSTVPNAATILVVDDTPANVGVLLELLGREGFTVLVARDGESALDQVHAAQPDLILLDVVMPGIDGFETCRRLKADAATSGVPVIFMTGRSESHDRMEGFRAGAADYVVKPLQHEEVLARVNAHLALRRLHTALRGMNQALEQTVAERTGELRAALEEVQRLKDRLQAENAYLQQELREQHHDVVGSSPRLREVLESVAKVAPTDATVLIAGETGTGKELIARAVHEASRRRARPMVKLNCAAMSAGLVESELFGHVKGAFTGASDRRTGRFELAHGGTLFLDEVSELPLDSQVKLLRVLQEQEFEPVGSSRTVRVDVRVIAATNRDLRREVSAGRFRADLYYRLNVFPLELPPLRERREDIPALAHAFLATASRRVGKPLRGILPAALETLVRHDWPGNVRDLQNTIERAVILCGGDLLTPADFELVTARVGTTPASHCPALSSGPVAPVLGAAAPGPNDAATAVSRDGELTLEEAERRHVVAVLRQTRGVIEGPQGAAHTLDLKPSTLRSRMAKLGIEKADYEPPSASQRRHDGSVP
jgi:formate hydrogenlyase transcriptional activator